MVVVMDMTAKFLSTPSARRATSTAGSCPARWSDFYPRPPRGGRRPSVSRASKPGKFLSTPSARRATMAASILEEQVEFLSTPSARRATGGCALEILRRKFLSTPSARRATVFPLNGSKDFGDFYPRPPRGGRHQPVIPENLKIIISIHALREEGDFCFSQRPVNVEGFLSTPSARRATPGVRFQGSEQGRFLSTPSARRAT